MRIVVDVKKGEPSQVILNNLYKHTPLQDTFGVIFLAIVDQRPRVLNLLEASELFLDFRREVVRRRTCLRAAEGGGARPRPRRLRHRPRPPRRGDRAHPGGQDAGRGQGRAHRPLRLQRDPGRRDPQAAAAAPDRPRAPEDRGRAQGAAGHDRRSQGHPRFPPAHRRHRGGRAQEDPGRPRQPAAHRDPGRGGRDHGRGHDRGRGRGHLHHPHRLHQAHDHLDLPRPEAGRPGPRGDEDAGRGLRQRSLHRLHPLLHPDLHATVAGSTGSRSTRSPTWGPRGRARPS